jgi:ribonuclease J
MSSSSSATDPSELTPTLSGHYALNACIHRGTQQIGGTCIELACGGARILLDLGLPLDAAETDPTTLLPPVQGLHAPDASLLALVLSHGHADHWVWPPTRKFRFPS